ncbi:MULTISPECIES: hypothetical protein [Actinotignum]|uniref:hypothetical protein n=1 Tax=Actinotignum TaxID=1653174 RepID=UPI00254EEE48|nr:MULTISPECIES: hypothetical protein [Actinotignum]MDK7271169.1 hypothetical protein [Actinotignum schaalii]MDY5144023.1 hypothetical protein [Actinotignum timonense]
MMTFHCGRPLPREPESWLNEELSEVIELCGLSVPSESRDPSELSAPAHRRPLP